MLKLYHGISSVCSVKVRIGLAEIGLDYESAELNLPKGDQFNPAYMKLNPAAVVPTLVDNELVLVESSLILDYLDRIHNDGRLMPDDLVYGETARHWLLRCIAIHAAINTLTFSTVMRKQRLASNTLEEISTQLESMPDPIARNKRLDLFERGLESPYVSQALLQLRSVFHDMSNALEQSDWLTTSEFGITDIALIAYIDRLERLGFEGLWLNDHPRITHWLAAMQARESYQHEVANRIPTTVASQMRIDGVEFWPELAKRYRSI